VELTKFLDIVKGTLKVHKLFDHIMIEEEKDGFYVKLKLLECCHSKGNILIDIFNERRNLIGK